MTEPLPRPSILRRPVYTEDKIDSSPARPQRRAKSPCGTCDRCERHAPYFGGSWRQLKRYSESCPEAQQAGKKLLRHSGRFPLIIRVCRSSRRAKCLSAHCGHNDGKPQFRDPLFRQADVNSFLGADSTRNNRFCRNNRRPTATRQGSGSSLFLVDFAACVMGVTASILAFCRS